MSSGFGFLTAKQCQQEQAVSLPAARSISHGQVKGHLLYEDLSLMTGKKEPL